MTLPKDPVMLMSFINTQLRDNYPSLQELAAAYMVEPEEIQKKLDTIGYQYNEELNKFV